MTLLYIIFGALVFIAIGFAAGISLTLFIFGKMTSAGDMVFKSGGKWTGEPCAWRSIAEWMAHEQPTHS